MTLNIFIRNKYMACKVISDAPSRTNKINDLRKSKSFFLPYIRNSIYFMNLNTVDI